MVEIHDGISDIVDVGRAWLRNRGRSRKAPDPDSGGIGALEPLDPGKGSVQDSDPGN